MVGSPGTWLHGEGENRSPQGSSAHGLEGGDAGDNSITWSDLSNTGNSGKQHPVRRPTRCAGGALWCRHGTRLSREVMPSTALRRWPAFQHGRLPSSSLLTPRGNPASESTAWPKATRVACRKARARLVSRARAAPRATRTTRSDGASIEYSRTALALRPTGACSSEPEPSCGARRERPVSYASLSSHFPMTTYRKSSPAMQRTAPHSA